MKSRLPRAPSSTVRIVGKIAVSDRVDAIGPGWQFSEDRVSRRIRTFAGQASPRLPLRLTRSLRRNAGVAGLTGEPAGFLGAGVLGAEILQIFGGLLMGRVRLQLCRRASRWGAR